MNISLLTYYLPQTIEVSIETQSPEKICLQVFDYNNRKTIFLDRYMVINGKKTLDIMMPISPEKLLISIHNDKNGKIKKDTSFKVTKKSFKRVKLKEKLEVVGLENKKVRSFIEFAKSFCFHCSYMKPQTYRSKDKLFFIEYLDIIVGENNKELNTPARVNKATGTIQISKKAFQELTVPERMIILLHEFSHFNINQDIDNETEADLNALLMYLGLGFPRIEATSAWIEVFYGSNNEQNIERYKIIEKFISDFENNKI